MKSNSTLVVVIRIVAFILLCLYSLLVFGQQDLNLQDKTSFSVVSQHQVSESALVSFAGNDMGEKIRLQWTLAEANKANSVIVEKSYPATLINMLLIFGLTSMAIQQKISDMQIAKKEINPVIIV